MIDTNIFCYLFDARNPGKSKISRNLISRCFHSECNYSVSVQNLAEFSVVVNEKIPVPIPWKVLSRFISDIEQFEGWNVIGYTAFTISSALECQRDYSLHFWDALLAATMKEQGIGTIYTEDKHLSKIPWLNTVNPYNGRESSLQAR
ncbi:MAG TPA: PIN domain-containing protein [Methanoregulaceae archaeon]|nr:PIN domain-containing protein [Methanoregulaceae archaeon]